MPSELAGVIFGFAFQMKLIGVIYLALAATILCLQEMQGPRPVKRVAVAWLVFGSAVLVTFVALNFLTGNPLLVQLQQSWAAHFSSIRMMHS